MKPKIVPSFNYNNCINCGICVQACPVSALDMTRQGKNGKYRNVFPELTDYQGCISCKQCVVACPMECINMASFYEGE